MAVEAVEPLARQALDLAKNALLVNLRFMNAAFARLRPFPVRDATLATDGLHIRFDPATLARLYAAEPAELTRAYLHIVLHNVFLHLYPGPHVDVARWDAACDIVVERTISELDLPATRTARAERQRATLARIDAALPLATAETVYRYLQDEGLDDAELADLRAPFYMDDHEPWYRLAAAEEARKTNSEEGERDEGADAQDGAASAQSATSGTDMEMPSDADQAKPNHKSHQAVSQDDIVQKEAPEQVGRSIDDRFADTVNLDRSKEQWKSAAYEMGVQLDAYAKLWGVEGANLAMNLRAVTREKQDYREFLRKFARMGEQIRVNDDEFDYVYYCYGLKRYGNLPLIEPLEYVEERRIRDFVIAIDTSMSTSGELVRAFLERTCELLQQNTSFFRRINLRILQCDDKLRSDKVIHDAKEFADYMAHFELIGQSATDFRPVFEHVDQLVAEGAFHSLRGLLYFTDGLGLYPKKRPRYDAAFVMLEGEAWPDSVPPWGIRVILREDEIITE